MRSALLTSIILIGLIALGFRNSNLPPSFLSEKRPARTVEPAAKVKSPATWTVEGHWDKSVEDAEQDALREAQARVGGYLRTLNPPIDWLPPLSYIGDHLVKKKELETKDFEEQVGVMRRQHLEIEVGAREVREMARLSRVDRSHERMFWLARVLVGLVTILGAVAGYVHLDERTKGYYTTLLRLGAASVIAVVVWASVAFLRT